MGELGFWTILQAAALVTAGFGIWILARACWEYAGLPDLRDRYLQLLDERLQELGATVPARPMFGAVPRMGRGAAVRDAAPPGTVTGSDAEFLRRVRRGLATSPSPAERESSQGALLSLVGRRALAASAPPPTAVELSRLARAVAEADTVRDLAATEKLCRAAERRLVRGAVPARFRAVFLPGMARYLDFVGRGSSLGLALGVLLAGGLSGNADLVGALTTVCGVGGAVIFTLTVIRCESRSWPAGQAGLWLRLARGYPQAYFLLRLALTTAALLLGVHLVRT